MGYIDIKHVDAQVERNLPKFYGFVQVRNHYMEFGCEFIPLLHS